MKWREKLKAAVLRFFTSISAYSRHKYDTLVEVLGWMVAINGAALISDVAWIPHFTGIDRGDFMLVVLVISLPLAIYLSRGD